ncbi:hypothetical protein [Amphritea sp.]|uniref:hypothetical protein n=1 Tax=Amphritea sp. TaxID=1872502 RepID=UPI0025C2B1AD|nr:hypothetical protein [Amphritea sp.]
MTRQPQDLERLIHESLEQLGWDADVEKLSDRVKRLNIGIPLEDEFSIICGWLGKCHLVHKLDQQQYPKSSGETYQVPDLLASFSRTDGSSSTVLIEVKYCKNNVMSFKPDYFAKLKAYSELLNLPLLIAWKRWNIWCLVSIDEFRKATKNYNLSFNDAMRNNLLSSLAGDFSYSLSVNAGVHISARKEKLIGVVETEGERNENWHMVIDDVYFTNGKSEQVRDLSPTAQQVFFSWDLKEDQTLTETHAIMHHICKESSGLFAHMALTRLLSFHSQEDEGVHWRGHLRDDKAISNISDYRTGIEENMRAGIVHHIFDIQPNNVPVFMK